MLVENGEDDSIENNEDGSFADVGGLKLVRDCPFSPPCPLVGVEGRLIKAITSSL